ncbi:MAG TPA: hypothetical protein VFE47_09625, partial [Tepidisphaeraceae bacterium]|nr:hypothetical protein [Tepidisphaeraceae bacterium]
GLQFMTDLDRLTLSHGRVSKPETMDFRTFKMIDGGFMCETIFGPENSPERRTRFGRIDLPAPIVPYLFRMPGNDGSPSLLSRTLKISDDEIGGLLEHNLQLDENDAIVSFTAAAPWKSGAEAIERLVTLVPDADLPGGLGQRANGRSALTPRAALVLPPDLRPLVLLHNGNFATADSNDLYRRLLNRANRLAKLIELKAPQQVILYERFQLQQAADQLFANGLLPPKRRIGGTKGEPLKDILSWMHFRVQGRNSKRVDYSARARTVFRRDLPVDIALVPRSIAVTLELPEHSPILLTRDAEAGEQSTPILIARAVTHDDPAIVLNSAHGAMLFGGVDSIPESVLHRPMLPGAIEEAEEHVGKLLRAKDPLPPSWLNTPSPVSVALDVVIAAAAGEELSFDCPTGILAAGPGCITITPVVEARQSSNKVDIAFP